MDVGSNQGWGLDAIKVLGVAHNVTLRAYYQAMSLPWWLGNINVQLLIKFKPQIISEVKLRLFRMTMFQAWMKIMCEGKTS